jgi:hypothetical protein
MPTPLIELPADDLERALRFWRWLLEVELESREADAGEGLGARPGVLWIASCVTGGRTRVCPAGG